MKPIVLMRYRSTSSGVVVPVTWNPADKDAQISLSNANLTATKITANVLKSVRATKGVATSDSAGYYFEVVLTGAGANAPYALIGIADATVPLSGHIGMVAGGYAYYQETGQKYTNNVGSAFGASYSTGAVIGVAVKGGKVWFAKNNAWQSGNPSAGTGEAFALAAGTYYPAVSLYRFDGPEPHSVVGRFKSSQFAYAPPSGFGQWQ